MLREMVVVDATHWISEDGLLPEKPARLRYLALRMARCIEYGGPLPREHGLETLIECRRRPSGRRCPGFLWVVKTKTGSIHAFCAVCRSDEFLIQNWEQTDWAEGVMEPVPMVEVSKA